MNSPSPASDYPFAKLVEKKRRLVERGERVFDFGVGSPRDATPDFLRHALQEAVATTSPYPHVRGRRSLRQAISGAVERRFHVALDPERHVLPVNGTKEGIFTSQLALLKSTKRPVWLFEPAYPMYANGARAAGCEVVTVRLRSKDRYLPRLEALDFSKQKPSMVWINYPHNPTGAEASLDFLMRLHALAIQHDFILMADECYVDLYDHLPPPSALQSFASNGFQNLLVFQSCSKRSNMAGYRSGFVAGDPRLIEALARARPHFGVATPEFVQAAAEAAWSEDSHVATIRELYRQRRQLFLQLFAAKGWHHEGGDATFYLWLRVPEGFGDSVQFAATLLELGILVTPGALLGETHEHHVRFALVAPDEDCHEAVRRLEQMQP